MKIIRNNKTNFTLVHHKELSKQYLFETEFLVKLISSMEASAGNEELTRHMGFYLVNLLVKGIRKLLVNSLI